METIEKKQSVRLLTEAQMRERQRAAKACEAKPKKPVKAMPAKSKKSTKQTPAKAVVRGRAHWQVVDGLVAR